MSAIACSAVVCVGQTRGPKYVVSARIGHEHRVYVRWSGEPDRAQPEGEEQADTEDVRISPDHSAVGWLVGRNDISDASYPETFELLVSYRGSKPRSLFPGRVIGPWAFENGGQRVALWDGTAHGGSFGKATLYDSRTGRQLAIWSPEDHKPAPAWALPLQSAWVSTD